MQTNTLPNADVTKKLYPKIVSTGLVNMEMLVRLIAESSAFNEGTVKGVIEALSHRIALETGFGRTVKVDGIGTFSALLGLGRDKVEEQKDGHNRNALSIVLNGISFRVDTKLVLRASRRFTPQRSRTKFNKSSDKYTEEERRAKALEYFVKYPVMLLADYMNITGLLHSKACRELDKWLQEPDCPIQQRGAGSHAWFELKEKS